MSGGQRARIALARALYSQAHVSHSISIMIHDELNNVLVYFTRRPVSVRHVDKIYSPNYHQIGSS